MLNKISAVSHNDILGVVSLSSLCRVDSIHFRYYLTLVYNKVESLFTISISVFISRTGVARITEAKP